MYCRMNVYSNGVRLGEQSSCGCGCGCDRDRESDFGRTTLFAVTPIRSFDRDFDRDSDRDRDQDNNCSCFFESPWSNYNSENGCCRNRNRCSCCD